MVLSGDLAVGGSLLPCPPKGLALESHMACEGEELGKFCGLMGILFLFSLIKKLAAKNSARYKNGCALFSPM